MSPPPDDTPRLPYFSAIEEHRDRLVVAYRGGQVDAGGIALRELSDSLSGFETAVWMAELVLTEGRVPTRGQFNNRPLAFRVRSAQQGSLLVEIDWFPAVGWAATAAVAPYLHQGLEVARKAMWKRIRLLLRSHVDRRHEHASTATHVQDLQSLVRESSGNLIEEPQACDFIVQVDSSLEQATRPLKSTEASSIEMTNKDGDKSLVFDHEDRDVLADGIHIEPQVIAEVVEITVRFTRINRKTGKGLVSVEGSGHSNSQEWCEVVDRSILSPNDPYTTAFSQDLPLRVRAVMVKPYGVTMNPHWRILGVA